VLEVALSSADIPLVLGAITSAGGIGVVLLALRPFAKALCDKWRERSRRKSFLLEEEARRKTRVAEIEAAGKADVARINATGRVLQGLAKLEPEQVERLEGRLERVRPPPDQLQPSAAPDPSVPGLFRSTPPVHPPPRESPGQRAGRP
jgi:hypothetical protein